MQKGKNNSYFLKICFFIGLGLVYLFVGLFLIVDTVFGYTECECSDERLGHPTLEHPGGSFLVCSSWRCYERSPDECSYGETRCYSSTNRQICGDYDSDSALEWSSPRRCSGSTSCGYGRCDNDERPYRYCSNGGCTYRCEYDSSCVESSCECSEGPCCDGCNFKQSTYTCDLEIQTQHSCPWGLGCGGDVGKKTRTKLKYCSGSSSQCTGEWDSWLNWTSWRTADSCGAAEVCQIGNSQCQYDSSCVSYTSEPEPEPEPEPELYLERDDSNLLMILLLGKKEGALTEWKKEIKVFPGEKVDFLLIVSNSSSENLDGVRVKVELPQEIIYRGNLKIGENPSEENINEGFNIGYLSSGTIETITFKGEISSDIDVEERDVIGMINIESLAISDSDSTKVAFRKPQEQMTAVAAISLKELLKKWYFWALLILGIIILFSLIKRFSSKK